MLRHTAPVLCLWLDKRLIELTDNDFDTVAAEATTLNVSASTVDRFGMRTAALRQVCFQQGLVDRPPRDPRPPARTAADHAADIAQPAIRRDVVRYAHHIATTLRPTTGQGRIKAIMVLCDWLADEHPDWINSTATTTSNRSCPGPERDHGGERSGSERPSGSPCSTKTSSIYACSSKTSPNGDGPPHRSDDSSSSATSPACPKPCPGPWPPMSTGT